MTDDIKELMIRPVDMNFVSKRWGWEHWIVNNEKYCGKIIFIKQGHHLSFHYHKEKDEVLYVGKGKIYFTYGSSIEDCKTVTMPQGYAFHVKPNLVHQMAAIEDTYIYEFSTTHRDEDSYRITTDLVVAPR